MNTTIVRDRIERSPHVGTYLRVVACRGWEKRTVRGSISGAPVVTDSPIGLVQYEGPGTVIGDKVMIQSREHSGFDKRRTVPRTIPLSYCLSVEVLS